VELSKLNRQCVPFSPHDSSDQFNRPALLEATRSDVARAWARRFGMVIAGSGQKRFLGGQGQALAARASRRTFSTWFISCRQLRLGGGGARLRQQVVSSTNGNSKRIARLVVKAGCSARSAAAYRRYWALPSRPTPNDTRAAPAIRICQDLLEGRRPPGHPRPKVSQAARSAPDLSSSGLLRWRTGWARGLSGEGSWESSANVLAAGPWLLDAVVAAPRSGPFAQLDWRRFAALMRRPAPGCSISRAITECSGRARSGWAHRFCEGG